MATDTVKTAEESIEWENRTTCPDSLLVPIFRHCADCVGVDLAPCESYPDRLRVKVTRGRARSGRISGLAIAWGNHGPFECKVVLPRACGWDVLDLVREFWRVAIHEMAHILDYQKRARGVKVDFNSYSSPYSMRRIRHDDRPQEKRADDTVKRVEAQISAGALPSCKSALVELAIWLESEKLDRPLNRAIVA